MRGEGAFEGLAWVAEEGGSVVVSASLSMVLHLPLVLRKTLPWEWSIRLCPRGDTHRPKSQGIFGHFVPRIIHRSAEKQARLTHRVVHSHADTGRAERRKERVPAVPQPCPPAPRPPAPIRPPPPCPVFAPPLAAPSGVRKYRAALPRSQAGAGRVEGSVTGAS